MIRTHALICLTLLLTWSPPNHNVQASDFAVADKQELTEVMLRIRATQFLQRTTFGPKDSEIEALADRMEKIGIVEAAEEWIDRQLALPPTKHLDLIQQMINDDQLQINPQSSARPILRYRNHAWWHSAIAAPDQLRQRIAWALAQIFVVNDDPHSFGKNNADVNGTHWWMGLPNYYDFFVTSTDSSYRNLLGEVAFSPVMGNFLGHMGNRKADEEVGSFPDENFAREILQLFSIGVDELHQDGRVKLDAYGSAIPSYDIEDVRELSRIFTGLEQAPREPRDRLGSYLLPMQISPSNHDTGSKVLFGRHEFPAGAEPTEEINAALDLIAGHPNVAPFISQLLIQRFVSSNPSRKYIQSVSDVFCDNGNGVRGDLGAVVKAILLHPEAWASRRVVTRKNPLRVVVWDSRKNRSRVTEPIIAATSLIRRYGQSNYPNGRFMIANEDDLRQEPYRMPSVFNFYQADFQPAGIMSRFETPPQLPNGRLVAPELQLMDARGMTEIFNWFHDSIQNHGRSYVVDRKISNSSPTRDMRISFDFSVEENLADDPAALAEYLDLHLCGGTMGNIDRQILETAIANCDRSDPHQQRGDRTLGALMSVYTSPAFWVHR